MNHQKPSKPKNYRILKLLPKAVSFQNHPFSPKRDFYNSNKLNSYNNGGRRSFSGPIVSLIPSQARRKLPKNSSFDQLTLEPTSPKVSCMGRIKHKKKLVRKLSKRNNASQSRDLKRVMSPAHRTVKTSSSAIRRMFSGKFGRKSVDAPTACDLKTAINNNPDRAPSLGQMRRFASGRDHVLASFDWTAHQVAPVDADGRDYRSDDEEEEEDVRITFSAPLFAGDDHGHGVPLQPRKEINLWKRRTMGPPRPLVLETLVS